MWEPQCKRIDGAEGWWELVGERTETSVEWIAFHERVAVNLGDMV